MLQKPEKGNEKSKSHFLLIFIFNLVHFLPIVNIFIQNLIFFYKNEIMMNKYHIMLWT